MQDFIILGQKKSPCVVSAEADLICCISRTTQVLVQGHRLDSLLPLSEMTKDLCRYHRYDLRISGTAIHHHDVPSGNDSSNTNVRLLIHHSREYGEHGSQTIRLDASPIALVAQVPM